MFEFLFGVVTHTPAWVWVLIFVVALFAVSLLFLDWHILGWSFLGAAVFNLFLAINHRRDRYIAT